MRLFLCILFLTFSIVNYAQTDIKDLISSDSLYVNNYNIAEVYQVKNADTILKELFFFNNNGLIDSAFQYVDLFGFNSLGSAIKLKNELPPTRIEYLYRDKLLIEKTYFLLDTILDRKYVYSYNDKDQLLEEKIMRYPNGKTLKTTYRYNNDKLTYKVDYNNRNGYKCIYDTLGVDEVRIDFFDSNFVTFYKYLDNYGSFFSYDLSGSNVSIVRFNSLGFPILESHSSMESAEYINRYTYKNGLIQKIESLSWFQDGLLLNDIKLIKYKATNKK